MKAFRVAVMSANRNSFGLKGVILVASDGETWQVGANHLCTLKAGDTILVSSNRGASFARKGFEIPQQLDRAPADIVDAIWKAAA
jgi:hypothetical protein